MPIGQLKDYAAMHESGFSVVATVNEPRELLCAFVAHYRSLGARDIHLFLDSPNHETSAILAGQPDLYLTVCDDAYWAATTFGMRPPTHVIRQRHNATETYKTCSSDWLLHVDGDEFVCPARPLGDLLAQLPKDITFARILTAERVRKAEMTNQTIFDGLFRLPRDRITHKARAGFGSHWTFFNDKGFMGHSKGKSLTRTGLPYRIDLHQPIPRQFKKSDIAKHQWAAQISCEIAARLAHFDGLTPLHWMLKLLGKYVDQAALTLPGARMDLGFRPQGRQDQMTLVHEHRHDTDALQRIARAALFVDSDQIALLTRHEAITDLQLDLEACTRTAFPKAKLDFSTATFDSRLRQERAHLIARTGFAG